MSNKALRNLLVGLAILMFAGAVGINWLFSPRQEIQVVTVSPICPPRPQKIAPSPTPTPSTVSYLTVTDDFTLIGEGTFIRFRATADAAADVAQFGTVSPSMIGRESYKLRVNTIEYDYQEVLDYLNSWDECYHGEDIYIPGIVAFDLNTPTPTPTLEPGAMRITDGPAYYGAIDGNRCYADIPLCGDRVCPVEWGREVSCDDGEPIPPTPTPTATPEFDVDGWIEWLISQWRFTPDLDDWLLIDWPDSIIITDALSQTTVIQGPATVRFNDETAVPTPARHTDPGSLDLSPSRPDLADGGLDTGRTRCPPCRCPPKYKSSLDGAVVPAPSASIDGECADGGSQ